MQIPSIPEPSGITPDTPDRETKKGLGDWTNPQGASGRVFYMNLKVFHYGTDDKTHAASIFLSIIIAVFMLLVLLIGLATTFAPIAERLLTGLMSAFTITIGIAVGKSGNGTKRRLVVRPLPAASTRRSPRSASPLAPAQQSRAPWVPLSSRR